MDPDAVSKITAQDFEDASNEEYAKFQFADIVTGTCLEKKKHILLWTTRWSPDFLTGL